MGIILNLKSSRPACPNYENTPESATKIREESYKVAGLAGFSAIN